jgi:hypothetical protein
MIPLAALEESALPDVVEFTERVQPVALVPITFLPSLVLNVSKSPFNTKDSSFSVLVEGEEDEEESVPLSLQAASAEKEDIISTDKQRARNCFLRFLILVFM